MKRQAVSNRRSSLEANHGATRGISGLKLQFEKGNDNAAGKDLNLYIDDGELKFTNRQSKIDNGVHAPLPKTPSAGILKHYDPCYR